MKFEDLEVWRRSVALSSDIYLAMKIGYIDATTGESWLKETMEISAMIPGFIKFRQRKSSHD